jgi:hypothetical protein
MLIFDVARLNERINKRFDGSPAAVVRAWPTDEAPTRSTIGRWLTSKTLPKSADTILGLAGALDLDPIALWHVAPGSFHRVSRQIEKLVSGHSFGPLAPAGFLPAFILPSVDWPPAEVVPYFRRKWFLSHFEHTATELRNYFAAIDVRSEHDDSVDLDHIWHFAWRHPSSALWRPYGFVRLTSSSLRLYSYSGAIETAAVPADMQSFVVETWFGEGPAEFRIASLHPFKCALATTTISKEASTVRFGFGQRLDRGLQ